MALSTREKEHVGREVALQYLHARGNDGGRGNDKKSRDPSRHCALIVRDAMTHGFAMIPG